MSDVSELLGPLPWSEENIHSALFVNPEGVSRAIESLPGYSYHEVLERLQLSHQIFQDAVSDVIEAIDLFLSDSKSTGYQKQSERDYFKKLDRNIRKTVFTAASAAMALVDHTRRIDHDTIEEYPERVRNEFAENPQHRFVQGLRNYLSHYRVAPIEWRVTYSIENNTPIRQVLLFEKDMQGFEWDDYAREFMQQHADGINLRELFMNYATCVARFREWFHQRYQEPRATSS